MSDTKEITDSGGDVNASVMMSSTQITNTAHIMNTKISSQMTSNMIAM